MKPALEELILAYEQISESRDEEAKRRLADFEEKIDAALEGFPGASREEFRVALVRRHRKWALKQENKPPAIPPKA